jgi:hypothetical protein
VSKLEVVKPASITKIIRTDSTDERLCKRLRRYNIRTVNDLKTYSFHDYVNMLGEEDARFVLGCCRKHKVVLLGDERRGFDATSADARRVVCDNMAAQAAAATRQ